MGQVLGGMLLGPGLSQAEKNVGNWLENIIFSHGIEKDYNHGEIGKCNQKSLQQFYLFKNKLSCGYEKYHHT